MLKCVLTTLDKLLLDPPKLEDFKIQTDEEIEYHFKTISNAAFILNSLGEICMVWYGDNHHYILNLKTNVLEEAFGVKCSEQIEQCIRYLSKTCVYVVKTYMDNEGNVDVREDEEIVYVFRKLDDAFKYTCLGTTPGSNDRRYFWNDDRRVYYEIVEVELK